MHGQLIGKDDKYNVEKLDKDMIKMRIHNTKQTNHYLITMKTNRIDLAKDKKIKDRQATIIFLRILLINRTRQVAESQKRINKLRKEIKEYKGVLNPKKTQKQVRFELKEPSPMSSA